MSTDMVEIDVEGLLDQINAQLNRFYSEHFEMGYRKPRCNIVLSEEQVWAIRSWATDKYPLTPHRFDGTTETLFGHQIEHQRRTPYLNALIKEKDNG